MIGKSGIAIKQVSRADPSSVAELAKFGVATFHEAMWRIGLMASYMRPIYPGAKVCGTAITVFAHPGDNWMLHVAAEFLQPGDVAVLGTSSENTDGMFGELLGTSFRARGALGLITDAGCRDIAELREMNFPVWSRAVHAKGTVKATVGSVNIPIICAGALVCPGDVVIGDADGVVSCRERTRQPWQRPRRRASRRKPRTARAWLRANWAWTSMECASRWPRRDLSISRTKARSTRNLGNECHREEPAQDLPAARSGSGLTDAGAAARRLRCALPCFWPRRQVSLRG